MGVEIERKFLVNHEKWQKAEKFEGSLYQQGYIVADPLKTVRVRVADGKGFITIKGLSVGASRSEYEYEIPKREAEELLESFCSSVVSKIRYKVPVKRHVWEVDEFLEENEGLLLAEIELKSEDEEFDRPEWISEEVTGDERYFNAYLSVHPFRSW